MENASKALLISAGVLIVVLLIAFGMRIFNGSSTMGDQVQDVSGEITGGINKGNSDIIYSNISPVISGLVEDDSKSVKQITASQLKTLISNANSYNKLYEDTNSEKIYIGIGGADTRTMKSVFFPDYKPEATSDRNGGTPEKINWVLNELYGEQIIYIKLKTKNSSGNPCKNTILCADSLELLNSLV